YILSGSDLLLVQAPGATRPMTPWRAGILRRYAAARVMKTLSWSPAPSLNVVSVQRGEQAWTVTVDSRQPISCPGCGTQSKSRHSAYTRTLRDLSAQGAPVIIKARLARWRCRNQRYGRRISTERLPGLAAPFARRTARLAGIVRLLGHSAGGRPSELLMRRLGMPVSDTTILRCLKEHARARSDNGAVHVAGIDDWAWRKGTNYGTIIVDLADGSNVGFVASICRTSTQWRQSLAPRRISALCWRGVGPKALPKSGTCSLRYAIVAIPGPTVIWHVSSLPGAAASLHSMATSGCVPSRRSQHRSACEHWIRC